jgi:hypothetical protein
MEVDRTIFDLMWDGAVTGDTAKGREGRHKETQRGAWSDQSLKFPMEKEAT